MALGNFVVLFYASYLIIRISYFSKYLFYPGIRFSIRSFNRYIGIPIIRFNAILIILFLVVNIIYITTKDITSLIERFTLLYIINLVLLALRKRINPMASIYKVKFASLFRIYEQLKSIVIAEDLIHVITAIYSRYINIYIISEVIKLIVNYFYFLNLLTVNAYKGYRYQRGPIILFYSIYTPIFL